MSNPKAISLPVLLVLAVGISAVPALAQETAPLHQWNQGTPAGEVQCGDQKVLMESPRGKPACVTEPTSERLLERGFALVEQATSPERLHVESSPVDDTHSHSHGRSPEPNFAVDMPAEIAVGQTVSINYTISWNNENGNPLYPESVARGYMDDVVMVPVLHLPDEIQVVSDGFELRGASGTSHNNHMQGIYYGQGILYDNTQAFEGSVQVKLLKPMFYEHDDIFIELRSTAGIFFLFQTVSADEGIIIVTKSDPRSDGMSYHQGIEGRYLYTYGFDKEEQKWHGGSGEVYGINSKGFPLLPEPSRASAAPPDGFPKQPEYIPREHWESFAEYLRWVEEKDGIEITREWLMNENENFSEEFVDDFFAEYPEFLTHDADFRLSFLPAAQAAAPPTFFVYGNYKVDGHEGHEKGGNNVTICAYDAEMYDSTGQILKNGSSDVCDEITSSSGYFSLYGVNTDSENSLMDLKFGVKMKNDYVEVKGTHDVYDTIEPITLFEEDEDVRHDVSVSVLNVGDVGPLEYQTPYYFFLDVITQAHEDLEDKTDYDAPPVDVVYRYYIKSYP